MRKEWGREEQFFKVDVKCNTRKIAYRTGERKGTDK